MGVSYAPCPLPSTKASQAAIKKWKAEVSKKPAEKKVKACPSRAAPSKTAPPPTKSGPAKKISVPMIARPKAKPRPRGTSEMELALPKHVGVSKKFRLLDVAASSHGLHAVGIAATHVARVLAFDNLSDVHKTPSSAKTVEKCVSPLPSVSSEFLCFSFALFPRALITILQVLPSLHPRWICH
jgi:hypothetical protein